MIIIIIMISFGYIFNDFTDISYKTTIAVHTSY